MQRCDEYDNDYHKTLCTVKVQVLFRDAVVPRDSMFDLSGKMNIIFIFVLKEKYETGMATRPR